MSEVEGILAQEVLRRHGHNGPLSPAQVRILQLSAMGLRRKAIAAEMHLSEETVKEQLRFTYRRLNANNGSHAVAIAVRKGII